MGLPVAPCINTAAPQAELSPEGETQTSYSLGNLVRVDYERFWTPTLEPTDQSYSAPQRTGAPGHGRVL